MKEQYRRLDVILYITFTLLPSLTVSSLSEQVIPTEQTDPKQVVLSLLQDDLAMRDNICVLIYRVLFKNLPFFSLSFDGVVEWHIKHDFYEEMSTKSKYS